MKLTRRDALGLVPAAVGAALLPAAAIPAVYASTVFVCSGLGARTFTLDLSALADGLLFDQHPEETDAEFRKRVRDRLGGIEVRPGIPAMLPYTGGTVTITD